jgi:hypothetical protein
MDLKIIKLARKNALLVERVLVINKPSKQFSKLPVILVSRRD